MPDVRITILEGQQRIDVRITILEGQQHIAMDLVPDVIASAS